jgi:hypothetical protein
MTRRLKNPVDVSISRANAWRLVDVLYRNDLPAKKESRLALMLSEQIDDQVGSSVVLTISIPQAKIVTEAIKYDAKRIIPTASARSLNAMLADVGEAVMEAKYPRKHWLHGN